MSTRLRMDLPLAVLIGYTIGAATFLAWTWWSRPAAPQLAALATVTLMLLAGCMWWVTLKRRFGTTGKR